jgi:hypothetical protein
MNSSILKNFGGAIKQSITTFLKKFLTGSLFTCNASPNDFIELGTSSEALGYMGYMDMLGKFFSEQRKQYQATGHRHKVLPEATRKGGAFFRWVGFVVNIHA